MSDSNKTKKELLAEIEALRAKLDGTPSERELDTGSQTKGGITRRDILASAWVAPVILTVPLGASFSQRAQAQAPMPHVVKVNRQASLPYTHLPTSARWACHSLCISADGVSLGTTASFTTASAAGSGATPALLESPS